MKKNLKFKISFFVSLSIILIALVTSMVYAFISTTSTRGEIEKQSFGSLIYERH